MVWRLFYDGRIWVRSLTVVLLACTSTFDTYYRYGAERIRMNTKLRINSELRPRNQTEQVLFSLHHARDRWVWSCIGSRMAGSASSWLLHQFGQDHPASRKRDEGCSRVSKCTLRADTYVQVHIISNRPCSADDIYSSSEITRVHS